MKRTVSVADVTRANIEYHTKLANSYNEEQPYFSPENIERVDGIIGGLAEKRGNNSLLDVGCGTGFILNIAKKYFKRVVGIDITRAMLDQVDAFRNVEVKIADSSHIPFEDGTFDICTAYSVLHHLPKLMPTFKEVFRCLKVGGAFYADGDPNYYCWRELRKLQSAKYLPRLLWREVGSVCRIPADFKEKYNLSEDIVKLAEYHRYMQCGMKQEAVVQALRKVGFSLVDFQYRWFLGEGDVFHGVSPEVAKHIGDHMGELLPVSRGLFKYVSFIGRKEWEIK